jgi:hypothetical protein
MARPLADSNRVLDGEGRIMPHVKFRSEHDLERPFVRQYISVATEHARKSSKKLHEKCKTRLFSW